MVHETGTTAVYVSLLSSVLSRLHGVYFLFRQDPARGTIPSTQQSVPRYFDSYDTNGSSSAAVCALLCITSSK